MLGTFPSLHAIHTSPLPPRDGPRRATLELPTFLIELFSFLWRDPHLTSATHLPLFQLSPYIYPSDGLKSLYSHTISRSHNQKYRHYHKSIFKRALKMELNCTNFMRKESTLDSRKLCQAFMLIHTHSQQERLHWIALQVKIGQGQCAVLH